MLKRTADTENQSAEPMVPAWRDKNAGVMNVGLNWGALCLEAASPEHCSAVRAVFAAGAAVMAADNAPCGLTMMSSLFNLAPVDEDILLMSAAAHRLLPGLKLTPHLLQQALGIVNPDMLTLFWQRLSPHSPLRKFRLLCNTDRSWKAGAALEIEERILGFLFGEDALDEAVSAVLHPVTGGVCPARHRAGLDAVVNSLRGMVRPRVHIMGPNHSGRRAAACHLAEAFGLRVFELRAKAGEPIADLKSLLARETRLSGLAVLIDADSPEARTLLNEQLSSLEGLIIAISETHHDVTQGFAALRLDPLQLADRQLLWAESLAGRLNVTAAQVDALASQFKFGPRTMRAVAAHSKNVWQACREQAQGELGQLAERINPGYGWDDIVLPATLLAELKAAANQIRHQALVFGTYGFGRKHQRGQGVSVLLAGASGTGKTMAAEVMAFELQLDLYRVDLSRVVSKYIGESEKNLRAIFDAAEASGAILLFDEADALFGKRSEVKDAHDRFANIEVSYLLQRMESYGGMAILSTNLKSHIDTAFMRRLRFVIDFPFPDSAARREIWLKAFPEATPRKDLDYDALARLDIAGGNIVVIAINAAFLAAAEASPVTMVHIAEAARSEFRKIDRELRLTWAGENQNG